MIITVIGSHILKKKKKINRFTFALKKLTRISNLKTALTAYHGHIGSILRYGLIFWGNSSNVDAVFKSQKRSIRAMCDMKSDETCKPKFKSLKILTLPSLYIYELTLFIRSNLQLFEPVPTSTRSLRLRPRNQIKPEMCNTALLHKSVFGMASKIYLPIINCQKT